LSLADLWRSEVPWLTVVALVLTGALLQLRPHDRTTFINTLWLFLFGVVGQAAAVLISGMDFPSAARTVHTVFRIVSSIALIRMFGFAVFRLLLPLLGRASPRIVEDIAIIVAYVIYGMVQLRGLGVDLTGIIATSAVITAVLAFAMQDTLGNMLGGIALQLDSSVQVGDWIRVDTLVGRVRDIRWRSTVIETRDWETVIVPNSMLMKGRVSVLGRREGAPLQLRRILNFMVDPGVPPARVIAIVEDEMQEVAIPNVARAPAPSCVLYTFEEGNLRYQLRYFLTNLMEDDLTDSMVRVHLFASLQRAGIRIAEPQRTVHAVARDEAHAETVRRRELTRRLEIMRNVDMFAALSESERNDVAERLQYAPFARGDIITKQGDASHWLYIVAFGEAEVLYEPPGGKPQVVGTLHAGQFFGEMGLLAGEARSATVLAKTDVECYRLDKSAFQGLLLARPEIADEVSRLVGSRRSDLEQAREAFTTAEVIAEERPVDLVGRIRRFFGLRRTGTNG
jgi:small-conductance mechanosensitive channel/CRP-like cAMP-binding protein